MEINSQYNYYEVLWLSQYPTKNNEHVWFCAVLYKKTRKRQMELHDEHNTVMSVVYDMNHWDLI